MKTMNTDALDDAILAVMYRARMTYHIANCLRFDYKAYRDIKTDRVRRRLERMEKAGIVSRTDTIPYKTQIAWVRESLTP